MITSVSTRRPGVWIAILLVVAAGALRAEDWPEVAGKGRLGVWNETGILDKFPADGLKVLWRTPIKAGYAGPAVADGRVFILDWVETQRPRGTERALALERAYRRGGSDAPITFSETRAAAGSDRLVCRASANGMRQLFSRTETTLEFARPRFALAPR